MTVLGSVAYYAFLATANLLVLVFVSGPYAELYDFLRQPSPPQAWWRWFISPVLFVILELLFLVGFAAELAWDRKGSDYGWLRWYASPKGTALAAAFAAAVSVALALHFNAFLYLAPALGPWPAALLVWGAPLAALWIRVLILELRDRRALEERLREKARRAWM